MSAFVGLLQLDGAPTSRAVVAAMLASLPHRSDAAGRAQARVKCDGAVGLGFAPQFGVQNQKRGADDFEATPNGNKLWLTGDFRLDKRDELARELSAPRDSSDAQLILAAYGRWNREAPAHLHGDWAFAIWDASRQRLFCARDRVGTRPFYFAHSPGRFFACANEIKALWSVPKLEKSVDETQIGNYLLGRHDDPTATFYRTVRRLAPASWLEIEVPARAEAKQGRYWKLDAARELILPRDEDYASLLREVFTASVRERTRCQGRLATFLSGGLDSSCVAAVAERECDASQRPLIALSTVYNRFAECDERRWIHQTRARGAFEPIEVVGDDLSPLGDIERVLWHLDGPSFGLNTCSSWAQYRWLQAAGVGAVLDGHGGDEVVFMGYERIEELLRNGDFSTAWREMRALRRHGIIEDSPAAAVWGGMLWHAGRKRGLGRLISTWNRATSDLKPRAAVSPDAAFDAMSCRLLAPDFAARFETAPPQRAAKTVREEHLRTLHDGLQPLALETLDAIAGAHGLESRTPFWDADLVELCLSFPADQKMRDGFNRYALRRAMDNQLASEVQWRPQKTEFSRPVVEGMRIAERGRIEGLIGMWEVAENAVGNYVSMAEVRAQWQIIQAAPPGDSDALLAANGLWRVLNLGLWMSHL